MEKSVTWAKWDPVEWSIETDIIPAFVYIFRIYIAKTYISCRSYEHLALAKGTSGSRKIDICQSNKNTNEKCKNKIFCLIYLISTKTVQVQEFLSETRKWRMHFLGFCRVLISIALLLHLINFRVWIPALWKKKNGRRSKVMTFLFFIDSEKNLTSFRYSDRLESVSRLKRKRGPSTKKLEGNYTLIYPVHH